MPGRSNFLIVRYLNKCRCADERCAVCSIVLKYAYVLSIDQLRKTIIRVVRSKRVSWRDEQKEMRRGISARNEEQWTIDKEHAEREGGKTPAKPKQARRAHTGQPHTRCHSS